MKSKLKELVETAERGCVYLEKTDLTDAEIEHGYKHFIITLSKIVSETNRLEEVYGKRVNFNSIEELVEEIQLTIT